MLVALCAILFSGQARADGTGSGTGITDAELGAICARLRSPDYRARRQAADEILALAPSAAPALMARLARRRVPTPATLWNALKRVEPPEVVSRRARRGRTGTEAEDRAYDALEATLRAPRDSGWAAALAENSEAIAVIRVLGRGRTVQGLSSLIAFMPRERQTYRREVAFALLDAGNFALPSLIRCKRTASDDEMKRFCRKLVEELGKTTAAEAVQEPNNELLADILMAFGDTKDPTALGVVASFINSEREVVREAARRATAQYGGNAIWALRQAYENFTGQEPPSSWDLERTTGELYGLYDRARTQEFDRLMNAGLSAAREGRTGEMVDAFDRILARDPRYGRRSDMVPGLLAFGEELLQNASEDARAESILRKAQRLAPEGPHASRIRAHLAYLEGKRSRQLGALEPELFETALGADPRHPLAKAALEEIEAERDGRKVRRFPLAVGVVLFAVALLALSIAVARSRAARVGPTVSSDEPPGAPGTPG